MADFLGESNLLPGAIAEVSADGVQVALNGSEMTARGVSNGAALAQGHAVRVMVRPQNLNVSSAAPAPGQLSGQLLDIMITGSLTKLYLQAPQQAEPIVAAFPTCQSAERYEAGQTLSLHWHVNDAVVIAE
ncbi:TOBE domain protein [compost metagenome]